jgi:hypothetical protein
MPPKRIPISQIRPSAIRHEQLPLVLTARIRHLQQTLGEVFPKPLETWIDEFKRDANPESEVLWWERLTSFYVAYTKPKDLALEQKKAVFKILFTLGMGGDFQSLTAEIAILPEEANVEISAMLGPKPN